MTTEQFLKHIEDNFKIGLEIIRKKNQDYSGTDPFRNFKAAEFVGLTPEQGILLRMQDKMMRLGNLVNKQPEVGNEAFEDTLMDLQNYCAILLTYIQTK